LAGRRTKGALLKNNGSQKKLNNMAIKMSEAFGLSISEGRLHEALDAHMLCAMHRVSISDIEI
jgi:hypothetical protein